MRKTLFLIYVLLMTVQMAGARTFVKTHEDFVHLSDYEKDQMIIKTMELVTELESRYEKDLEQYGFNQDRFEKYQKALTQISEVFLGSAHAADAGVTWEKLGNDFIQLIKRPDSRCIFAGWVSNPSNAGGKTVCNHPGASKDKSPEAKSYPQPDNKSECKKGDPKKIQCSPVIFGFKKESDQSLFCVDATSGAHNSSFNCMQAALAVGPAQKGDSKEVRLKNLRARLDKNKDVFKGAQEFIYKTCVCENIGTEVNLNKDYHNYMRPHRTCYGLMEMMGETIICEDPKLPVDVSIFQSLKEFTKTKSAPKNKIEASFADAFYKQFIDSEVKNKAPKEFARLCGGGGEAEEKPKDDGSENPEKMQRVPVKGQREYLCTGSCKPDKEHTFVCSYKVTNYKKDKPFPFKDTPTDIPKSDKETSVVVSGFFDGQDRKISCEITVDKPDEPEKKEDKPSLKVEVKDPGEKEYKITATVTGEKGEWIIVWKTHTPPKKGTPPKDGKIPGLQESKDINEEEKKKDEKPAEKKTEENITVDASDKTEKTQVRGPEKIKVCGELKKGDDVVSGGCVDVDPLKVPEAPKPPTGGMNGGTNGGMQPMQPRPTSDVSGIGIR